MVIAERGQIMNNVWHVEGLYKRPLVFALCALWVSSAGAQAQVGSRPAPAQPVQPIRLAPGHFDADSLWDIAVAHEDLGTLEIWLGAPDDQFINAGSIAVNQPTSIAISDLDGDGIDDIAVVSRTAHKLIILAGDGSSGFVQIANLDLGFGPLVAIVEDVCGDGFPELFLTDDPDSNLVFVHDIIDSWLTESVLGWVTDPSCSESTTSSGPCNNFTEPACDVSPMNPGIQECMRAANCRARKCRWAACIERQTRPWWIGPYKWRVWEWQVLACEAVQALEVTGCLPSYVLP